MWILSPSCLVDAIWLSSHFFGCLSSRPMATDQMAFLSPDSADWQFSPTTSTEWPFYVLYDPYAVLLIFQVK